MSELSTPYAQGTPAWVDMMTTNRPATMDFYRGLLGWDYEVGPLETGNYTLALVRGKPVAGLGEMPADALFAVVWTTYLATDDVDESLEKVTANGGQVLVPVFDTEGSGRGALAADPTGASFGLWEAGTHIGSYLVNEPGSIIWNELATRDPERASAFYQDVFELGLDTLPDFPYTHFQVDDRTVAGVYGMDQDIPAEIPAHWMAYFAVADVDASTARVAELGGIVVSDPVDSRFGRYITAGDPLGATFRLIQVSVQ